MSTLSPRVQLSNLAQKLLLFQNREYESQRKAVRDAWLLPLQARVHKGSALANVSVPEVSFMSMSWVRNEVKIRIPVNNSNFRVGSLVLLHQGNPFDSSKSFRLEVKEDLGKELVLFGGHSGDIDRLQIDEPGSNWVLDADIRDFRWIIGKALGKLAEAPTISSLADILVYKSSPVFNETARTTAQEAVLPLGLNEKQQEAFVNAYATENYYLIQGPPGTGKTWVLAQLAAAFARTGQRVLVTSSNHLGINNALHKIRQATGYPHVVKVGKPEQTEGLGEVSNYKHCPDLTPIDGQAYIVGGTTQALWTNQLSNVRFDVVIADEASQLNMVQAAAAMLVGTRFIFIGDHQQMPPIIAAEHPNPEYCKSIFEYLFELAPGTMLNTTYRMNEAIADFSSRQFYGGELKSHNSAATRTFHLPTPAVQYADVFDHTQPSVFVDLRHANTKTHERSEAHYIADMIAELLACGVPAHEIAVVAPYRAQGRAIRKHLNKRCVNLAPEELVKITIDTVERMQGQERDVVFLSLTSGTFDTALQRASFYFMPNRLNVAITRARVKRVVIGSSRLTDGVFESPDLQKWTSTFRDFLGSCHCITRLKPLEKAPPASV